MAYKFCSSCGLPKSQSEYHKNKTKKDGLSNVCKTCANVKANRWRADNLDYRQDYERNYSKTHRDCKNQNQLRYMKNSPVAKAQNRLNANKRRASGTLTRKEWNEILETFQHRCAYCGRGNIDLHIEHIKPVSKGGKTIKSNIVPACRQCNNAKGNKPVVEFLRSIYNAVWR